MFLSYNAFDLKSKFTVVDTLATFRKHVPQKPETTLTALSCPILSHNTPPCPKCSHPALNYPIMPHPVPILPYPAQSNPSCLILPHTTPSCPSLPHPTPHHILSHPVPPYLLCLHLPHPFPFPHPAPSSLPCHLYPVRYTQWPWRIYVLC